MSAWRALRAVERGRILAIFWADFIPPKGNAPVACAGAGASMDQALNQDGQNLTRGCERFNTSGLIRKRAFRQRLRDPSVAGTGRMPSSTRIEELPQTPRQSRR